MGTEQRRARELRERRERIIAAATQVFIDRGFENATVDEVAEAAALGKGTLYLYFKSKDALLLAVCEGIVDTAGAQLGRPPDGLSGAKRVDWLMRAYAEFALDRPHHFTLVTSWLFDERNPARHLREFPRWRALVRRSYERLIDAIADGQTDGSVHNLERSTVLAAQTWGALIGLLLVSIAIDRTPDALAAVDGRALASSGIAGLMKVLSQA